MPLLWRWQQATGAAAAAAAAAAVAIGRGHYREGHDYSLILGLARLLWQQ
jgi:stage V sporulation protein SpoVS